MNKQSVRLAIWLGVLLTRSSCAPQLRASDGEFVVGELSGGRVANVELNRNVGNAPAVFQTNVPELTRVVMTVQPPNTQYLLGLRVAPQNQPQYVQAPQVQTAQSQYERELAQYRQALAEYQQKTQPQQRVVQAATVPQQPIYQQPQYVQQPYFQQPPQYPYNYFSDLQQQPPPVPPSSSNGISSFTGLFGGFSNALGFGSVFGF